MQTIDWLNENELRGYPLRENTARTIPTTSLILDPMILDANIVFVDQAMPNEVKLLSIVRTGNQVVFNVSNQGAFTITNVLTAVYPNYIRNTDGSLLVIGETIKTIPIGTHSFANTVFEDSVSVEMRYRWKGVDSIKFDNSAPLTGTISLKKGYQTDIKIKDNVIGVKANSIYGKPISTEQFFNIEHDCDAIVSSINGVTLINNPDTFALNPGINTAIINDPANHRIYIGLNFQREDVCIDPYRQGHPQPPQGPTDTITPQDGIRWEMPCITLLGGGLCTCQNPPIIISNLDGNPANQYDVTVHFRGFIERKTYSGGTTTDQELFYIGGIPITNTFNIYKLELIKDGETTPYATYFLNRTTGAGSAIAIDYTRVIRMHGKTQLRLTSDTVDNTQLYNNTGVVIPGVPPAPAAYVGQFLHMTIVSGVKV